MVPPYGFMPDPLSEHPGNAEVAETGDTRKNNQPRQEQRIAM